MIVKSTKNRKRKGGDIGKTTKRLSGYSYESSFSVVLFLVINFILPFFTKPYADAFGILLKSSKMMATLKGLKRSGQIIG
jgi:hypothetical protein